MFQRHDIEAVSSSLRGKLPLGFFTFSQEQQESLLLAVNPWEGASLANPDAEAEALGLLALSGGSYTFRLRVWRSWLMFLTRATRDALFASVWSETSVEQRGFLLEELGRRELALYRPADFDWGFDFELAAEVA